MPLSISWPEIALRLGLAFAAAFLIGLNRGRRGEAAGLRTTLLVCLAAAVSMIQVNLLLATAGRTASSFSVLDLMRLPLGILTGMGFIGAGAILKRGNLVLGVTTASSLWFTTVMGLCFGGGQIALGLICLALALFILTFLKRTEAKSPQQRRATLEVAVAAGGLTQGEIEILIREAQAEPVACSLCFRPVENIWRFRFTVDWAACPGSTAAPGFMEKLSRNSALRGLQWLPDGGPEAGKADPE